MASAPPSVAVPNRTAMNPGRSRAGAYSWNAFMAMPEIPVTQNSGSSSGENRALLRSRGSARPMLSSTSAATAAAIPTHCARDGISPNTSIA